MISQCRDLQHLIVHCLDYGERWRVYNDIITFIKVLGWVVLFWVNYIFLIITVIMNNINNARILLKIIIPCFEFMGN